MSEVGDSAMALMGQELPGFQEALQAWQADCLRWGNEVTWRDAILFLRGWRAGQIAAAVGSSDRPPPDATE